MDRSSGQRNPARLAHKARNGRAPAGEVAGARRSRRRKSNQESTARTTQSIRAGQTPASKTRGGCGGSAAGDPACSAGLVQLPGEIAAMRLARSIYEEIRNLERAGKEQRRVPLARIVAAMLALIGVEI